MEEKELQHKLTKKIGNAKFVALFGSDEFGKDYSLAFGSVDDLSKFSRELIDLNICHHIVPAGNLINVSYIYRHFLVDWVKDMQVSLKSFA